MRSVEKATKKLIEQWIKVLQAMLENWIGSGITFGEVNESLIGAIISFFSIQ